MDDEGFEPERGRENTLFSRTRKAVSESKALLKRRKTVGFRVVRILEEVPVGIETGKGSARRIFCGCLLYWSYSGGNLGRRTEFTFVMLLVVALSAGGVLIWASQTGHLTTFGDTVSISTSAAALSASAVTSDTASFIETFAADSFHDTTVSTALWNFEAGEATLFPGTTDGTLQSKTIKSMGSENARVTLTATEQLPFGSSIYYLLSADDGATWQPIVSGQTITVSNPGTDWRWRALLSRGQASLNPSIQELTFHFSQ